MLHIVCTCTDLQMTAMDTCNGHVITYQYWNVLCGSHTAPKPAATLRALTIGKYAVSALTPEKFSSMASSGAVEHQHLVNGKVVQEKAASECVGVTAVSFS
jgi:hypothetical protein